VMVGALVAVWLKVIQLIRSLGSDGWCLGGSVA